MLELGEESQQPSVSLAGFWSWVAWRSAYLTRLGALRIHVTFSVLRFSAALCRADSSPACARWSHPASVILT